MKRRRRPVSATDGREAGAQRLDVRVRHGAGIISDPYAATGSGKITLLTDPTGPVADLSAQRVTLAMRDGSIQTVIVRGQQLKFGEGIAIRSDMSIRREPSN